MRVEITQSSVHSAFVGFKFHILLTEFWASEVKSAHYKSSVGFGRREEGTQHAAKIQLSVRRKSRTDLPKTWLCARFLRGETLNYKIAQNGCYGWLLNVISSAPLVSRGWFLFRFLRNETVLFSVQGWTIYIVEVISNQSKVRNY